VVAGGGESWPLGLWEWQRLFCNVV
jgi:hypothetical protein